MEPRNLIPRCILTTLNQVYDLEQKLKKYVGPGNFSRGVERIRDAFAEEGLEDSRGGRIRLVYDDPMGQPVDDTRTDLEVSIAGSSTENLVVVEVIKPIIRAIIRDGVTQIVQRGVVTAESRIGK
jgi:hypothetical protein